MIPRPRMLFVAMALGSLLGTGPTAFAQTHERGPDGFDCAYQSPERVRQAIQAAIAAGEIPDPALRVLPRVAARTIRPGDTVRGVGVPTVTQTDIFQFEDTAGLLLTNFLDGQLFNLMAVASNAVMAAHGDNYDFIAFFLNFTPHHQIGAAFYLGLQNDVTGIGTGIFNNRALMGVTGDNVEGWVMMWKESSWFPGTTNFTALVLGQEFEHRFAMRLSPLLDGRVLQGDNASCGRSAHWNFRVDAQGSGMEVSEWVGASPATLACSNNCVNTDIGGVFSYPDLYLMGYVSGAEMDAGASELRYMNDSCSSPYFGTISAWTSADIVAANGARSPDSNTAQKDFHTAWVMIHQQGSPPTTPQLDNVVAILNSWNDAWISSTLGRGTMNNTLFLDCNSNGIPDADDIAAGTSADCNINGTPDECEPDCNTNAVADECDITAGTSTDCNTNGIPDECEPDCNTNAVADECDITAGTSEDCNTNLIPDECEPQSDCNSNLVQDICDIAGATSNDVNSNGIPDECEPDCNGNNFPDTTETPISLFLNQSSSLTPYTEPYTSRASPYEYVPIAQDIHMAAEAALRGFDITFASDAADFATPVSLIVRFYTNNPSNTELPMQSGLIAQFASAGDFACVRSGSPPCGTNQTFSFVTPSSVLIPKDLWLEVQFVQSAVFNDPPLAVHEPWGIIQKAGLPNTGTSNGVVFDAANGAPVAGTVFLDLAVQGIQCSSDCQPNLISDRCDISCLEPGCNVPGCGQSSDCNANGVPDECETDCNQSGFPDACDITSGTSLDCNDNTIPDECDIAAATSTDCNENAIPDECETDCNANGIPDDCDITFGTSLDCQTTGQHGFGIPDECEIPQGNPGGLCAFDCDFDCNSNGTPDICDAAAANDCQPNQIPDDCPQIDFLRIYDPDQTIGLVAPGLPINDFWQKHPADAQDLPDLLLERIGSGGSLVFSFDNPLASTGSRVFASASTGTTSWSSAVQLQAQFGGVLPTRVAIDVIPTSTGSAGRLEIFDADNLPRGSILSSGGLAAGSSERIFLDHPAGIARAVMGAAPNLGSVILDNLAAYSLAFDCNTNGIPDECEPDSDGDLLPDTCDTCIGDNTLIGSACDSEADPDTCPTGVYECSTGTLLCTDDPSLDDADGDQIPDCDDGCPNDPLKTNPGVCGCGVVEDLTDSDGDTTPDCMDGCPNDPLKTDPGVCGCGVVEDLTDSDGDATPDCLDACPNEPALVNPSEPGAELTCTDQIDNDCDGATDLDDLDCVATVCPFTDDFERATGNTVGNGWVEAGGNPAAIAIEFDGTDTYCKMERNNVSITQSVIDTTGLSNISLDYDWRDNGGTDAGDSLLVQWKPTADASFITLATHVLTQAAFLSESHALPATADDTTIDIRFLTAVASNADGAHLDNVVVCGTCPDSDIDLVCDPDDICPGFNDNLDTDGDGVPDGCDICPGFDDSVDTDGDGVPDGCDACPGFDDTLDADADGVPDACDGCPNDPAKTAPGACGCGTPDTDTDGDATPDCLDACPNEPTLVNPSEPGTELTCDDTIDNDCDGLTDLDDTDCVDASCVCGDFNQPTPDGSVNLLDFAQFSLCFGGSPSTPGCQCTDLNLDGAINLFDFATFGLIFGKPAVGLPPNCN